MPEAAHIMQETCSQERRREGERGSLTLLVLVNYYASSCETIL